MTRGRGVLTHDKGTGVLTHMMQKVLKVFSFLSIFLLCSCNQVVTQHLPIKTDVWDFDLHEAKKMIEQGDKLIADISKNEYFTRQ